MMLSRINSKNLNRVSEEGSFWQVNILSYAQAIYNLLYSKHNKKPPSINTPTRNRTNWSSCLQSTSFFSNSSLNNLKNIINGMSSYFTFRHSLISFVTKILFFLVKRKFYECILLVLFVSYKHQHFNGFISIKVDTFKE